MFWEVGDFATLAIVIKSGGGCISMSDCFRAWCARLHCGGSSRSKKMETSRWYTRHNLEETQDRKQEG